MAPLSLRRVSASLMQLVGLASLLASGAPSVAGADADVTNNTLPVLELDFIFPRNETYTRPEILPLAISMQRLPEVQQGSVTIQWDIMPYGRDGSIPGGIWFDSGTFDIYKSTSGGDATILVSYSNVSTWLSRADRGDRYMLQTYTTWDGIPGTCNVNVSQFNLGQLMFSIKTEDELSVRPDDSAIGANVTDAPDCPAFGLLFSPLPSATVVTISSSTTLCTPVTPNGNAPAGTPCAATVDAADKSGIASMASSMATSAALSSQSANQPLTTHKPTSTNAAVAGSPSLAPALAAVGVVYCLVFN